MSVLTALDYAAVLVFALTGALAASRAQLDLIGFAFLASLTALGGGTVRDLLLDRNPVFWIADPMPLAIACLMSTMKIDIPSLLRLTSASGVVRASRIIRSECCTREIHTFCPLPT